MTDTRVLNLPTTHGPVQVNAHTTTADGLYVYRNGSTWRLAHHTGYTLADFQYDQHAHNAAKALGAITDWTQTAEQLRTDVATFIYAVHDAIVDAGGTLLRTDDGPAAHALAARGD
ncbi:hypothetical protein OG301_38875 (plasmid) [Streptomyces platensis]|uniref:hypothetical protein n=1 Tax=Streptomyces platensis TaxID=58346 RepID=UPI002ED021F9|nr:hypothetical protein OG301_38875 [Streptomyces platensis]